MAQDFPVDRIMQTSLLSCRRQTPLCEAAAMMAERCCSAILVMEEGRAVGIWTEHDCLSIDFDDPAAMRVPIDEVMSSPVATLRQGASIGEAALHFASEGHRHLLVVDRRQAPLGIITQTDVALNQGLEPYLRLRDVASTMRGRPLQLSGDTGLGQAARRMKQAGCDAAVIDCGAGALGILTERDMVRFVARHPGGTSVGGLASRPLLTVQASDALLKARDLLIDHRVRHLGVLSDQGEVVGLLGFGDILLGAEHLYLKDLREALEQRDRALTQSRLHLQMAEKVIDSSLEGVIITDADTRIEFVNPAFTQMTGYTLEEAVGKTPAMLSSGRQSAAFYREMWETLQEQGCWRGEIWNRRKSGELYLELLTITAIHDEEGEVTHYAALFSDITYIRENEERVKRLAYYDPLTGLPNRRLLDDRLKLALRHAHRQGRRLAVIFIDLDHFKQVNDALGHAAGDELLLRVSQRLHAGLREDDTLARLSGDEFIVLLNDVEEVDQVTRVARRLIDTIGEPFKIDGQVFRVGCSLGIGLYPDDATTASALVRCADSAMYQAKQEGRNTYRLFRADMHQQDAVCLQLETDLRNTAETGEGLGFHLQPLICRDSGEVGGAEALLRWQHPTRGAVSPGEFIPLAERSGLILPLGERLLHLVAGQLRRWLDAGYMPPRIAINLSAREFWQSDLVGRVQRVYRDYRLPPGQIGFELTESVLLDKWQNAIAILKGLRELGCRLSIDDFGTGYSSLSYLQELPVTTIKIDRSFIQGLGESRGSTAIVAAVTGMARELELRVVAEGVETQAQLDALSRYPVHLIQGFFTGRPTTPAIFAERYLARREQAVTEGWGG
ncbi:MULTISPECIES: EAL domain-containing protein [unclassified Halomonas]|uniref:EAL domain-containing protein n=1 Tax=unclassified Halomonas TaxID=2609666 RepID=UPI002888014A|nr:MULTISPECIES: EAL domain-containing protein [unclassified Halomonas]MDT0500493.1 EAL domain-containing protein [Halomonas sp. PAR7]MDT0511611.1 EAL domain-containing protein [Halomonas sp. LES1]MDT0590101.1 EAL domain-containing protein [Halomonas sp. PAR8]